MFKRATLKSTKKEATVKVKEETKGATKPKPKAAGGGGGNNAAMDMRKQMLLEW